MKKETYWKKKIKKIIASILTISFLFSDIAFANPDISTLSAQSRYKPLRDGEVRLTHLALQELLLGTGGLLEGLSLKEVDESLTTMYALLNLSKEMQARRLSRNIAFVDFNKGAEGKPASIIFTLAESRSKGKIFGSNEIERSGG